MFTGLITAVGTVATQEAFEYGTRLTIEHPLGVLEVGSSMAVSGVCLTVVESTRESFVADISPETLSVTTLGEWELGQRVNLEPPLCVGAPLDGHIVQGHVDGVGRLVDWVAYAEHTEISVAAPEDLMRFIAVKGSIALDGISLTVNRVSSQNFTVNIIPWTRARTALWWTLKSESAMAVNLEVDCVARYVLRARDLEAEASA